MPRCYFFNLTIDEEKNETSFFDNRDIGNTGHRISPQAAKNLFDLENDLMGFKSLYGIKMLPMLLLSHK